MILKGNARTGGDDLASHLMNAYENDALEVAHIKGTVAQDLHGAFAEMEAIAAGTRCRKSLYSLSVNPPRPMTRDQYATAIDRIENRLGLSGQPRAIVFHVKEGREHCHVVWSRIDPNQMRAVQLSHDRQKLRGLAQELGREFGHDLPEGLARNRTAARFAARAQNAGLADRVLAERAGITPEDRRAQITGLYRASADARTFIAGLADRGYHIAQGDRRSFVVIDHAGTVHSLSRQVDGARAADIRTKLLPLTPEELPTVKEVRAAIKAAQEQQENYEPEGTGLRRPPEELARRQTARRVQMQGERQALETKQRQERLALHAAQKAEADKPFARAAMAVLGLLSKVPVLRTVIAPLRKNPNVNIAERHRLENEALGRRYVRETVDIDRRDKALDRVETRENKTLARDQRRMALTEKRRREGRTAQTYEEIRENGRDATAPLSKAAQEWKVRREKLARDSGIKPGRGKGYKFDR